MTSVADFAPSFRNIDAAAETAARALHRQILRTPLVRLPWLDDGRRKMWAKLECSQVTGSFKIRGAFTALSALHQGQSVVTASAGNHGLAVATAAQWLGRDVRIFVPLGASEPKVRKLQDMGARVEFFGDDLYDAAVHAADYGAKRGMHYVSPFDDPSVVAGQATISLEILDQLPEQIDHVVVPLGGGGLLLGVASVLRARSPDTRIHAAHPRVFQRHMSHRFDVACMAKTVSATIADGLMVQHPGNCWVGRGLGTAIDRIIEVEEEAIRAAVFALLHREALLVEGAGAIAVAPFLMGEDIEGITGNVVVILSGGNLSVAGLTQSLATSTSNSRVRALLGLRTTPLPLEQSVQAEPNRAAAFGDETSTETLDPIGFWKDFAAYLEHEVDGAWHKITEQHDPAGESLLEADSDELDALKRILDLARGLIAVTNEPGNRDDLVRRSRLAIQMVGFVSNAHHWSSAASYAVNSRFFVDPSAAGAGRVNYDRYGYADLLAAEALLTETLGFDNGGTRLLMTSSGQAAYSVIDSFLFREVLSWDDCVITAPYIYFETGDQIAALKCIRLKTATDWSLDAMFALLDLEEWKVLFIDPLANIAGLPIVDFCALARHARNRDWRGRWLVVDGTMVSGGFNPFALFAYDGAPQLLYYESASKYLQVGLDLQMAGFVASAPDVSQRLAVHRRNLGAILYPAGLARFPLLPRRLFLARMKILSRNAESLARALRTADHSQRCEIGFPDNHKSLGWAHGGGVVTVRFKTTGLNNKGILDLYIQMFLEKCRIEGISAATGVSFGFSTTRVSAAAAMANTADPFLRFSLGDEATGENRRICAVAARTLREILDRGVE